MSSSYDASVLCRCLDDEAKFYWAASLLLGAGSFLVGLAGIFFPTVASPTAYIAAALTVVVFLVNHRFEASRGKAQELRRKLDLQDSFGWSLPLDDFHDLLLRCSKRVKNNARGREPDSPYFASQEPPGPVRALQNMRESAWWSEHLSEKMYVIGFGITGIVLAVALCSLVVILATVQNETTKDFNVYSKFARAITSLVMLLFSLNLIKLTISYDKFSRGAAKCKTAANAQLKKNPKNKEDAIVKVYEYFIVRSGSPVLPTWLWKWNRDELNDLFPYKDGDTDDARL